MSTTLITGAGLIGCHVARVILDNEHRVLLLDRAPREDYIQHVLGSRKVTAIQGDIQDMPLLIDLVKKESVQYIVHTAGLIGSKVYTRPNIGFQVNVQGSLNVAETARLVDIERVVFCSSMAVYALSKGTDSLIDETFLIGPDNIYGATKLAAEQLLHTYGKTFGFDVISLRLAGVYGYGPYEGGSWMGRVLYRLLAQSLRGRSTILNPAHLGVNEYVYVEDVARALYQALTVKHPSHEIFNIGTGMLTTYEEITQIIASLLPQARIAVGESSGEAVDYLKRSHPYSISRAEKDLRFIPQYDMRKGLSAFIETLREIDRTGVDLGANSN